MARTLSAPSGQSYDAIVIGGGIIGAATAHALAKGRPDSGRAPRRTLLLDAREPAHERGSSHGDGRIVRFTYAEAVYLEMARQTYPLWAAIERDADSRLLETTGSWECGPENSPILAELVAGLGAAGIPFEELDPIESRRRFRQFAPPAGSRVLYQKDGAIVRAGTAVETLWRLASELGADVKAGVRVESIEADDSGVTIEASSASGPEQWHAEALVVTAGGWSGPLLGALGLELPLEACREVVAYFPEKGGVDHGYGSMPTVIDYSQDQPFYALPRIDIPGVKVGWHHTGPPTDPEQVGEAEPRILEGIGRFVAERFPHLVPEVSESVTCLYTNTPDYHFVLDHHPRYPRVVVGAGFSGHGFKFGPIVGELLAHLAIGEPPPIDLDAFSIGRFDRPLTPLRGA